MTQCPHTAGLSTCPICDAERIEELEAENAKLKVLESLVLELVEDYTITDKRVRAALEGENDER